MIWPGMQTDIINRFNVIKRDFRNQSRASKAPFTRTTAWPYYQNKVRLQFQDLDSIALPYRYLLTTHLHLQHQLPYCFSLLSFQKQQLLHILEFKPYTKLTTQTQHQIPYLSLSSLNSTTPHSNLIRSYSLFKEAQFPHQLTKHWTSIKHSTVPSNMYYCIVKQHPAFVHLKMYTKPTDTNKMVFRRLNSGTISAWRYR